MRETDRTRAEDLAARARRLQTELDRLTEDLTAMAAEPAPEPVRTVAPALLTPEEAAEALSLSRTAVFALLRTGELDSVQIGKRRRVPVTAIEAYVAGLQRAGVA